MYAKHSTVKRPFSTFVGIDLGGARGKTTVVARLSHSASEPDGVVVDEVCTRHKGTEVWHDDVLLDHLRTLDADDVVLGINAPLTVPACLRCQLGLCPGKSACEDPAVQWLQGEGSEIIAEAIASDRNRIALIPGGPGAHHRPGRYSRKRANVEPYTHRASEVLLHYRHGLLPRDSMGSGTGPIAARALHLRRFLHGLGFELNHNLLEVSPRATVHSFFGARKARGYKRDADPWETRASIIEGLSDMRFAPTSRLSREEVLSNDHCFEALLSGYTAYLYARDGWTMPDGVFAEDGWIWAPY